MLLKLSAESVSARAVKNLSEGTVENISRDISVDQATGYAYYIVKVSCENMTLIGKDGEEASLMNGMACQAKIVVDEQNVLNYCLEKIDLID